MGGTTSNTIGITTEITSNFLQESSNTCQANTVSGSNGDTVIISGTVKGDVNISSTSSASASCSMSNNVSSISQTIISNGIKQSAYSETDFFGDFSWNNVKNNTNLYNGITNNMTQITTNTCQATSSASTSNNFVYVTTGGVVGGGINLTSNSNANASCSMANTSKAAAYQEIQNNIQQEATHVGMIGAFMSMIVSVLIIIAVIAVVLFTACEVGSVMKTQAKCKSESGCDEGTNIGDVALSGIAAGSDVIQSGALNDLISSSGSFAGLAGAL